MRGATTGTVDGRSRPIAFRAAISRNARPMPPSSPTIEPTAPVMNASISTDRRICGAAGAEGAQHGQLARPLRDHDPEDVVDEERAGDERDAGEPAQHDVELADPLLEVVLRLLGGRVAGDRLDAGRQHRPDVADELLPGETPRSAWACSWYALPSWPNAFAAASRSISTKLAPSWLSLPPKVAMPDDRRSSIGAADASAP